MPRPKSCRRVACHPLACHFKPQGIPLSTLEVVILSLDELEALRLIDFDALSHEDAAHSMGVSRATAGRIVERARRQVTDALLHGKALRIEGGAVKAIAPPGRHVCPHCRRRGCRDGVVGDLPWARALESDANSASTLRKEP